MNFILLLCTVSLTGADVYKRLNDSQKRPRSQEGYRGQIEDNGNRILRPGGSPFPPASPYDPPQSIQKGKTTATDSSLKRDERSKESDSHDSLLQSTEVHRLSSNRVRKRSKSDVLVGAGAENVAVTKGPYDEDNLERLCNDPFHSFLCKPVVQRRRRIDGRLRPQAVIPPGVLPDSSNVQESRLLPEGTNLRPSQSSSEGYHYPKPMREFQEGVLETKETVSTFYPKPTTTVTPARTTRRPTLKPNPSDNKFSSILPTADGYQYAKPSQKFEEVPKVAGIKVDGNSDHSSIEPSPSNTKFSSISTTTRATPSDNGYQYTRPTDNQIFTQAPTTKAPSTVHFSKKQSNDRYTTRPSEGNRDTQGYDYKRPTVQFTLPQTQSSKPPTPKTTSTTTATTDPDIDIRFGASNQRNVESLVPASAQNPSVFLKPGVKNEEDNLDRLCNDPFHSFLCKPITQKRRRLDGRIRAQAKLPPGLLIGESSFRREITSLPNGGDRNSPPAIDKRPQRINLSPSSSNSNFVSLSPDTTHEGYEYPKPPKNQEFTLPTTSKKPTSGNLDFNPSNNQFTSITTTRPSSKRLPSNGGYRYPKPINPLTLSTDASNQQVLSTSKTTFPQPQPTGYSYLRPDKNPFTLPNIRKETTLPSSGRFSPSRPATTQPLSTTTRGPSGFQTSSPPTVGPLRPQFSPPSKTPATTTRLSSSASNSRTPSLALRPRVEDNNGYKYEKPRIPFTLPPITQTPTRVTPGAPRFSTDSSQKGSDSGAPTLALPSERSETSTGYDYPKPVVPFTLPTTVLRPLDRVKPQKDISGAETKSSRDSQQRGSQISRLGMILSNYNKPNLRRSNTSLGKENISLPPENQFEVLKP